MPIKLRMPAVFKKILESNVPYYLLYGGRLGGKTNNTAKIGVLLMLLYPYFDGVVMRVNYGSLQDSSYAEIEAAIDDMGDNITEEFKARKKSPLRIERRGNAGNIYFMGYGGSNTSRTKSFKPKHKLKFVIMEETQELKDEQNLNEALASIRRHLDIGQDVKIFILGNPRPQKVHWFSKLIETKKFDPDWLVLNVTYADILPFINDFDLKEILKTKLTDEAYYKWFYLGEMTGGFGLVYPMFQRKKYVITEDEWNYVVANSNIRPIGCLIGGDGAVNNDCTVFVPKILLNNGQSVDGPIFHHDPKKDGVVGYHQLVQNKLLYWFEEVCNKFKLGSLMDTRMGARVPVLPIWMYIDSAAADLIAECRFFLSDRCSINPVKKSTVPEMVSTVQSALLNENIIIIDYGGYKNYTTMQWVKHDNYVAEQFESVIWNARQDNYEPSIPNDDLDAETYAVNAWYKNQENIQHFNICRMQNRQTVMISDIIKTKERK